MSTIGFSLLTIFFACMTYDSMQFRRSARHRVWAVVPPTRERGVDHLSVPQQQSLQTNRYVAIGGLPGVHWVFALLTVASAAATAWSWFD
jgi:hypothetical protein